MYYGFASHYLDFDDAQANLAGHFSTVLYSALLAVLEPNDTWHDFFRAYIIGAELEGIIGSLINPAHRTQGWHSTGDRWCYWGGGRYRRFARSSW